MSELFISDTHYGHSNILRYDARPFASIEEHDAVLKDNILTALTPGDTLYHLGDIAWSRPAFIDFAKDFPKSCRLFMIKGNHDNRSRAAWGSYVDAVYDTLFLKLDPDSHQGIPGVWLSHYPHLSWPNSFHGSLHLFGHVHGNTQGVGRSMDVSANVVGYRPIRLCDVVEKLTRVNHTLV